jgi:S-adenosylmethionine decarboxylase proenzyme
MNNNLYIYISILISIIVFAFIFNKNNKTVGVHYLIDIDNIENTDIESQTFILNTCKKILENTNMTILNSLVHKFEPQGMTAIYLLSESHFSLHTWPEFKKIRMDLFTCSNDCCFNKAEEILKTSFPQASINIRKIYR